MPLNQLLCLASGAKPIIIGIDTSKAFKQINIQFHTSELN